MKFVPSREEIILRYARSKEVLGCGSVENWKRIKTGSMGSPRK